jgi:hypothetical protein
VRYITTIPISLKTDTGICELDPGDTFKPKNSDTELIKFLLTEEKIKPLKEVMIEEYKQFIHWLGSHKLTADKIQKNQPELLKDIHDAIELIEACFLKEDFQRFNENIERTKRMYLEAVDIILNISDSDVKHY